MIRTPAAIARLQESFTRIFVIPEFEDPKKRIEFLAEMPDQETYLSRKEKTLAALSRETHEGMRACYAEPLLTKEQEFHLFRKYNLLKYLAKARYMVRRFKVAQELLDDACVVRNQLVSSNLRLAISLARKYSHSTHWDDFISESYMSVLKIVDYFDFRRGFKFSTYATWALRQNLMRSSKQFYQDDTKCEFIGDRDVIDKSRTEPEYNLSVSRFEEMVGKLDRARDRKIIRGRYLYEQTLQGIADSLDVSVSKERIRQLETRSLDELRTKIGCGGGMSRSL